MKRVLTLIVAAALGGSLSLAAVAAGNRPDFDKEVAAALMHANSARQIDVVSGVHLHLHHVLNCVLGPRSKSYSAAAEALSENPCKGLGNGALADAGQDPAVRADLERAVQAAERGIAATSFNVAHEQAGEVLVALEAAQQASK